MFVSLRWLAALALVAAVGAPAFADEPRESHDRTQFGHDITIGADEQASDVTCFSCSVRVRGHVAGDITTFAGTVTIEQDAEVAGDTTVFGGDLRLEQGATVQQVTLFGGKLRRDPSASIHGDVTAFGGGAGLWLFVIFGLPFVVLGALIALIVWLIRKLTRPAMPVAARV